ncbi:hypothetical protein NP603_05375 [Methylomonas sp. SURF-1]|uniref:Uncharacterized protein n=1 Tax=Methylomonas aurea TaxID=2952224 RepID=A0ABT1UE69_9GAMM|nr:hypothetical protein [Methylomonas sp. SURF-1]MCQ8180527.1 hypothetical protein [Methylomonas sp. SURF-1]
MTVLCFARWIPMVSRTLFRKPSQRFVMRRRASVYRSHSAGRLGPKLITVCLDFDERVIRMGYGDFTAVELLRDTGVASEKQQFWGYLGVKSGSFYTTFGLLTPFLCFFTTYLLGWAIPTRFI